VFDKKNRRYLGTKLTGGKLSRSVRGKTITLRTKESCPFLKGVPGLPGLRFSDLNVTPFPE
jgi:hypothetical protein